MEIYFVDVLYAVAAGGLSIEDFGLWAEGFGLGGLVFCGIGSLKGLFYRLRGLKGCLSLFFGILDTFQFIAGRPLEGFQTSVFSKFMYFVKSHS